MCSVRLRPAGRMLVRCGARPWPACPTLLGLRLEYLEIVDPEDMQPVESITGAVRVAGALWVGGTRLIDNLLCLPPAAAEPSAGD